MEEQQTAAWADFHPFREYERKIRDQLTDMFAASNFDAKRYRRYHSQSLGSCVCQPAAESFLVRTGSPPSAISCNSSFGRIAFANTDLSGDPSHVTAIGEGAGLPASFDGALRGWHMRVPAEYRLRLPVVK
jgi:hypothetical protein